jgi:hypothetical protein
MIHNICAATDSIISPLSRHIKLNDGTGLDLMCSSYRALADTGYEATTLPHKFHLHNFQTLNFEKYMADASNRKHASLGEVYLKTKCDNGDPTSQRL